MFIRFIDVGVSQEEGKKWKVIYKKHDNIKYSDNWSTPKEIYNLYVNELGYHDPCELYSKSTVLKKRYLKIKL